MWDESSFDINFDYDEEVRDHDHTKVTEELSFQSTNSIDNNAARITSKATKKKLKGTSLRKAPQAPKRFKSSYIMFFIENQQDIKDELGPGASVGDVSKRSSEKWKSLPPEERAIWDEKAKADKERYDSEKAVYTGPWQIPWQRAKKDPSAPKRPMSAFLHFSKDKRRYVREQNPGIPNTEISRILGNLWKESSDQERDPYIEKEASERESYRKATALWKDNEAARKEKEKREDQERPKGTSALMKNDETQSYVPAQNPSSNHLQSYSYSRQAQYYPPPPPPYPVFTHHNQYSSPYPYTTACPNSYYNNLHPVPPTVYSSSSNTTSTPYYSMPQQIPPSPPNRNQNYSYLQSSQSSMPCQPSIHKHHPST